MNYTKEEMIQAVDNAIEAFKASMGTPESITINSDTSLHLFGEVDTYKGIRLIKDELCEDDQFFVNSGIEEL